ncbi:hypothetical protein ABW20_dc0105384 [Dactylellina cionopaga]|nr:hypothetical protein ABW20_dc0105384 [Dactylellina cionopaga]
MIILTEALRVDDLGQIETPQSNSLPLPQFKEILSIDIIRTLGLKPPRHGVLWPDHPMQFDKMKPPSEVGFEPWVPTEGSPSLLEITDRSLVNPSRKAGFHGWFRNPLFEEHLLGHTYRSEYVAKDMEWLRQKDLHPQYKQWTSSLAQVRVEDWQDGQGSDGDQCKSDDYYHRLFQSSPRIERSVIIIDSDSDSELYLS